MPTYAPGLPVSTVVPGGAGTITVEQFLRTPSRVQRAIDNLTLNRFLADQLFGAGDAQGGAVLYDELSEASLFATRDVQAIEPGSEFPVLTFGDTTPRVAAVSKWGGAGIVTYEAVRRNARDELARQLTLIRNTIIRKVDSVGMRALLGNPRVQTLPSPGAWSDPAIDLIGALETARTMIDDQDLGYQADTVVLNPAQRLGLKLNTGLRNALPRETAGNNLLGARDLNGLLGFDNYFVSNRIAPGTVLILQARQIGSQRDELPLYTRTVDQPERERWLVQAARVTVPIITDPLAAVKITGA